MSNKTIPFSARISLEDAEFIAGLSVEGAVTPSDKLRTLLAEARRRAEGRGDYASALQLAQDWLTPLQRRILAQERELGLHSVLLQRVLDWLPELLAYLLAAGDRDGSLERADLYQLERGVGERLGRIAEQLLQTALLAQSSCYSPQAIEQRIPPILALARLLCTQSQQGEMP